MVVCISGKRRPESHFHSQTLSCQHLGSTEGFRKKVNVSGLNQQVHEGDIPERLSR